MPEAEGRRYDVGTNENAPSEWRAVCKGSWHIIYAYVFTEENSKKRIEIAHDAGIKILFVPAS